MCPDIRLTGKPLAQRITDRLKSLGDGTNPSVQVTHGSGPTRTITHVHMAAGHLSPNNTSPRGDGWKGERK